MSRRFTWVELLVVIIILAVSLAILIPVVNSHRESARRTKCEDNSHQIGLAMQNYASIFANRFPPSAQVTKATDGTQTVGHWSFLGRLAYEFMGYDSPFKSMPYPADPEKPEHNALLERATAAMIESQPIAFLCPSSPGGSKRRSAGITNYKAMGATTRGSLVMVVNPQASPPYGTMSPIPGTVPLHPDGAIFPAADGIPAAAFVDGLSHTIFTIETIDEAASRWSIGKEATLVGMPQSSSPTGTTPQPPCTFFVPPGYDGKYGPDSAVAKAGLRTFLSYDFSPSGPDAGKYEDAGFGSTPPAYGPSSPHPEVVICGMGDGSVQQISKRIDAANLFFLITKSNADPFMDPL